MVSLKYYNKYMNESYGPASPRVGRSQHQLDENALNIYTDGSSYTSPRRGGIGILFIAVDDYGNEEVEELSPPGWKGATNNQMELQAPIDALRTVLGRYPPFEISRFSKIVIHSDSTYVVDHINSAKFQWASNGWITSTGTPVLNTEQWKELVRLIRKADQRLRLRVEFKWVKGHRKDPHNKAVDKLAKQSAAASGEEAFRPKRVRRKLSPNPIEPGSVRMEGQTAAIRVITDEYLNRPHRCYRYQYEVTDPDSAYYQKADAAFSDHMLSAGHVYVIKFNQNSENPRIDEVLCEMAKDGTADGEADDDTKSPYAAGGPSG